MTDLLPALMSAAERFSIAGRELYLDFLPNLRAWHPITDLVGKVRLGMWFTLPDGREMVFEVILRPDRDGTWTIGGGITLEDDSLLQLPEAETAEPAGLLERYADDLLQPARWHLDQAVQSACSP
ncbi:hypothetical protein Aph01nite_06920 [Acrocarpospora phusangensis]|uniref:Uncharacterized protein n=1 Tax=Acrocarpospora phusangensis TaxID=1070424 RepID=A0A919ULM9_9ACTN|nr:hypothetical protein [Acrocarpospora phusangensis]GIH22382.1 hypothetical protein Aph01nite_06920 [Acrocarpospora phusangensis]